MKKAFIISIFFCTVVTLAFSQEAPLIPELQAIYKASTVRALLQSSDYRQQAWGAWLAGQSQMRETISLLQEIVEKRIASSDWRADEFLLDAALDALIQLEAQVSPAFISAVYKRQAVPALIFLSKIGSEGNPLLLDLASREHGNKWFAAADLLLAHRTPGTAALLMKNLQIVACAVVSEDGSAGFGRGSSGGSGGDGGVGIAPGYPPLAFYYLTTGSYPGSTVLAAGPTTVYYHRTLSAPGQTPMVNTHEVNGPQTEDRLRYIAALGNFERQMPLHDIEIRQIRWRGQDALDAEINELKQDILRHHSELIRMLVGVQLLTEEEVSALPVPRIDVQVQDFRTKPKQ